MDQEMKDRWINALESQDYGQTTGKLRRCDSQGRIGYCCLGVLKDINGAHWAEANAEDEEGSFLAFDLEDEPTSDTVFYDYNDVKAHGRIDEHDLITKLSVETLGACGIREKVADHLIQMNDDGLSSFRTIAEYIRHTDLTTGEPLSETAQAS